jgi:hypothetical protein
MKRLKLALGSFLVICALALTLIWGRGVFFAPTLRTADSRGGTSSEADLEIEQYAIFSAVLERSYVDGRAKLLVFQSETTTELGEPKAEIAEDLRSLASEDTIDSFFSRNGQS